MKETSSIVVEIENIFKKSYENDPIIKSLLKSMKDYNDANAYAQRVGDLLGRALIKKGESIDFLFKNGELDKYAVEEILSPILKKTFSNVADVCEYVQKALNTKADISLNAVRSYFNASRLEGFLKEYTESEDILNTISKAPSQFANFFQSSVDNSIKANCQFHFKLGMKPKVIRILGNSAHDGSCEYCRRLSGVYDYSDIASASNDVWRRHTDCTCTLIYVPSKTSGEKSKVIWGG